MSNGAPTGSNTGRPAPQGGTTSTPPPTGGASDRPPPGAGHPQPVEGQVDPLAMRNAIRGYINLANEQLSSLRQTLNDLDALARKIG